MSIRYPQFFAVFPQLMLAVLVAGLVALVAYRAGALSRSGARAALLVGSAVFGAGGWPWAVLLLAFFLSSSALSRAFAARKVGLNEKFAKGSRRDAGQVLANGGLPALLALVHWIAPGWNGVWAACAGALAAVNADTWATELGVLSSTPPRSLRSGRVVERGESGGVTWAGILASLAGGLLIALPAAWFAHQPGLLPRVVLAGLGGSLFDSLLGATVQAQYHCPVCGRRTEHHPRHSCGSPTTWLRGWPWLNNDLVNLLSALVGALLALM